MDDEEEDRCLGDESKPSLSEEFGEKIKKNMLSKQVR